MDMELREPPALLAPEALVQRGVLVTARKAAARPRRFVQPALDDLPPAGPPRAALPSADPPSAAARERYEQALARTEGTSR